MSIHFLCSLCKQKCSKVNCMHIVQSINEFCQDTNTFMKMMNDELNFFSPGATWARKCRKVGAFRAESKGQVEPGSRGR